MQSTYKKIGYNEKSAIFFIPIKSLEYISDLVILKSALRDGLMDLLCLTPISAIFRLYHGDQF